MGSKSGYFEQHADGCQRPMGGECSCIPTRFPPSKTAQKTLTIYTASRASIPARSAMWRQLRASGWPIISTWIDEAGDGETADFTELWERIFNEILLADALLLYAEAGDFPLKGALIETGIAVGMRKPVVVCLPGVTLSGRTYRPIGSWTRHPSVKVVSTLSAAHELLFTGELNSYV